jgi:AcrR family transcriptional regulator
MSTPGDRRQALISAAFDQIAEHGLEGLRLRPVAAAAGIDHSTLHHHFATKDELIAAVLEHVTTQLEGSMSPELAPADRLRQHLRSIGRLVSERPELFVVLRELDMRAQRDETTRRVIDGDEQGWRDALAGLFEEGIQLGSWATDLDVDASVELVISTLRGLRLRSPASEAVVEQLCDLFTHGSSSPSPKPKPKRG